MSSFDTKITLNLNRKCVWLFVIFEWSNKCMMDFDFSKFIMGNTSQYKQKKYNSRGRLSY